MTPFCDFLSVSMPVDLLNDSMRAVRPLLDATGFETRIDALGAQFHSIDRTGLVRTFRRSRVGVVSASGRALRALREAQLFGDFLHLLGSDAHRVTRLDATLDVTCDAPGVIAELAQRGRAGLVALSRKAVAPGDVQTHLASDARGVLTGSVYFGSPSAKVRGVAYDKRHQVECTRAEDIGPCLRYEIRCKGDLGPTLADAYDPTALFWHFASPDLLTAPPGVHDWVSHSEGFTLPAVKEFTPAELMRRVLDRSGDVQRLLELARLCGPHGVDLLCSRLRSIAESSVPGSPQATEAPSAPSASLGLH